MKESTKPENRACRKILALGLCLVLILINPALGWCGATNYESVPGRDYIPTVPALGPDANPDAVVKKASNPETPLSVSDPDKKDPNTDPGMEELTPELKKEIKEKMAELISFSGKEGNKTGEKLAERILNGDPQAFEQIREWAKKIQAESQTISAADSRAIPDVEMNSGYLASTSPSESVNKTGQQKSNPPQPALFERFIETLLKPRPSSNTTVPQTNDSPQPTWFQWFIETLRTLGPSVHTAQVDKPATDLTQPIFDLSREFVDYLRETIDNARERAMDQALDAFVFKNSVPIVNETTADLSDAAEQEQNFFVIDEEFAALYRILHSREIDNISPYMRRLVLKQIMSREVLKKYFRMLDKVRKLIYKAQGEGWTLRYNNEPCDLLSILKMRTGRYDFYVS